MLCICTLLLHKIRTVFYVFLQVMLGGKNIEEGFGIAYRVIQVCSCLRSELLLAKIQDCKHSSFFCVQKSLKYFANIIIGSKHHSS